MTEFKYYTLYLFGSIFSEWKAAAIIYSGGLHVSDFLGDRNIMGEHDNMTIFLYHI